MSSRDKSLIAVLVLVVIAVGGYFLIVAPQHSKANRLESSIKSQQSELAQAERTVQSGEAAEAEYKSYQRQYASIAAAVPADTQIPQLINELQSASNKSKVSFQAVSASSPTASPATTATGTTAITFPSQSLNLSFTGSYFAVANLLGQLDSFVRADDRGFHASGRLLSISGVSESPTGASGTTGNVAGDVTASVTAVDYDVPSTMTTAG